MSTRYDLRNNTRVTRKDKTEAAYRAMIDGYLHCGEDSIFFYWKGRVALYALLKAMGVGPGDEVIVQGFTCIVVPNAIIYLGATPIYADIDTDTYNLNMKSLRSKISEKTKVIICQNTFGLSSNLEEISLITKDCTERYGHTVYSIEDCTHGFGGKYKGKPNGISCDASFFSTQWSKPFSTGLGGFCAVHNETIKQALVEINGELLQPGFLEQAELKLMYSIRKLLVNDVTYWPMVRLYRWMSRHNIVLGSSSGEETSGIKMPKEYFKAQSAVQFSKGIRSLKKLEKLNRLRRNNALAYTDYLKSRNKHYVSHELFADHIFIRYPLLVNDRTRFREEAERKKIILGEWFEAPIYPTSGDLSEWKLDTEQLPNAMYVCEHIVNLPTETKDPGKVISFLKEHDDLVI